MPTYEFRCPTGHDFERFYGRISEAPSEVSCPDCGETATRRISGGAGLVFKGSGFYITDYGKDGKKDQRSAKPAAKKEGGESAAPAAGESAAAKSGAAEKSGGATPAPAASTPAPAPSKPASNE